MTSTESTPASTEQQSLSDFLLARIAEDEVVARAATVGPWRWEHLDWVDADLRDHPHQCIEGYDFGHHGPDLVGAPAEHEWGARVITSSGYDYDQVVIAQPDGEHIARHDPMRVLAECEAKRRVVELHGDGDIDCDGAHGDCETLRALASAYADHPDYREDWRP